MENKDKDNLHSSDDEQFVDANEKIVNELLKETIELKIDKNEFDDEQSDSSNVENNEKEIFEECEENDLIDDELQKDQETNQTEEEREACRIKAEDLKIQGNELYKQGEYEKSIDVYTKALRVCPVLCANERSVIYGNRAAAKQKLDFKSSAIDDCTKSLSFNSKYVKVLLRRAAMYEETDKLDESLEDFKKVMELDPGNIEATAANIRLPPKINDRNERMKAEMIDKLKDLGNMILRPFGLSTNNFQLQQDPSTGSYSVNFNQNNTG